MSLAKTSFTAIFIVLLMTYYLSLNGQTPAQLDILKPHSREKSSGVHAIVSFSDSLIKGRNSYESCFRVTIYNDSEQNYYIPEVLTTFMSQTSDSLSIFKKQDGNYKRIHVETGMPKAPYSISNTTAYLSNTYFSLYKDKKAFADSLISKSTGTKLNRNINALFLKPHESFTLYQIDPAIHMISATGDYRIDFKIKKRQAKNLPAEISGFQVLAEDITVEPLFITVQTQKHANRIILRDSRNRKIRSFIRPL